MYVATFAWGLRARCFPSSFLWHVWNAGDVVHRHNEEGSFQDLAPVRRAVCACDELWALGRIQPEHGVRTETRTAFVSYTLPWG